jgi:hypothetical protein
MMSVAFIEVFSSTIRPQTVSMNCSYQWYHTLLTYLKPVDTHALGLSALALAYIGWTYIGYPAANRFEYSIFDYRQAGWPYVSGAIAEFVALTGMCKAFIESETGC